MSPIVVTPSELLVRMESPFGFRAGTAITLQVCMRSYKKLKSVGIQEFLCENVVLIMFPSVQRFKDLGFRVRIALVVGNSCSSTTFMSGWNPASLEELIDSFHEVSLSHLTIVLQVANI